jgi:hypothetical protein
MDNTKRKPVLCPGTTVVPIILFISAISLCRAQTTKVFLLAGQSNMVGWAAKSNLPQEFQAPRPDIQIYWNGAWTYLKPGLGGDTNCFGPEIKLCRDIVDSRPGEDIVFIKYAVSGTSLWNDWRPVDGVQYINFLNAIDDAVSSVNEPEIIGMFWMQGESDAWASQSTLEHAQEYEQNLTNFIHQVRTDLGVPDLPFVIARISQSPTWTWGEIVRQAQLDVGQNVANTAVFDTNDLALLYNMHYDAVGTITLGERFAAAVDVMTLPTGSYFSGCADNTLSWRYTMPQDSNRVLVVGVCGEDDDACDLTVESVKYDYVDMHDVVGSRRLVYGDGEYMSTQLFYLLDSDLPAAGNHRLEINFTGVVNKRCAGAAVVGGADQQAPCAIASNAGTDANGISTDIDIGAGSAWIIDIAGAAGEATLTAGSGQMTLFNIDQNNISAAASVTSVTSTGLTTVGWNLDGDNSAIAQSAVAFAAVVNTISGQVRRVDDTPVEGVKVAVGGGQVSDTTDPNGCYRIPVFYDWSGTVEPAKDGHLFGPSARTYNRVAGDLTAQDYEDISSYDLDQSGALGWGDLQIFGENWLATDENSPCDFYKDQNHIVNFLDFADFVGVCTR